MNPKLPLLGVSGMQDKMFATRKMKKITLPTLHTFANRTNLLPDQNLQKSAILPTHNYKHNLLIKNDDYSMDCCRVFVFLL